MRLTGAVTVHGSKPATTAVVELHNSTDDVVDQVQVDDDGKYAYHLSSGTWTLRVWDRYGHRGGASITVADGEDQTLDIVLDEPEGGH
jgi:hypothetical protein